MKIQKAICLCVDKRKEYWPFMVEQFQELGIPLQLFIGGKGKLLPVEQYNHIDTDVIARSWSYLSGEVKKNTYNIYLCHQKMIKIAKDENLDNVLLLEDDALVLKRFATHIDEILNLLGNTNWDTCYLGYHEPDSEFTFIKEKIYQNDKVIRILPINNIGGFHGVLLNHTSFDTLLSLPPVMNMDVQCPKYTKTFYSIPRLIFYRNVYSASSVDDQVLFKNYEYQLLEGLNVY